MLAEGTSHFGENVNDMDTHINIAEGAYTRPVHITEPGR